MTARKFAIVVRENSLFIRVAKKIYAIKKYI